MDILRERGIVALYHPSLRFAALEVTEIFPKIRTDLEHTFGWNFNLKPSVLLVKDGETFQRMAESPLTVAFAVPRKNLIVIDHSRVNINPFNLEIILKHELCHLLLHHHVKDVFLPRWLDEGVSQWASDGMADILLSEKHSALNRAVLKGSLIPFKRLAHGFPRDKASLSLAYEESKSLVTFIVGKYGRKGILSVLEYMRKGEIVDTAILKGLSVSFEELEEKWRHSIRQRVTWFTYLAYNIYEILFVLAALITVYAFIRAFIRKRSYMKEDENDLYS